MSFDLTKNALLASQKVNLEPQLVLEIDGVTTKYGARIISKYAVIGEELVIGDDWTIGGLMPVEDQNDLISLTDGTSTSIKQQLDPSKGIGSSISSMQIALVDKNGAATELVSPGVVVEDILGRRAKVYLGFQNTAFPDDYIPVFRGIIDDIQAKPGSVVLNLAHPDQKKRQTLFPKLTGSLVGDITNSDGLIFLAFDGDIIIDPHLTADEDGINTFVKIGSEWLQITYGAGDGGVSGPWFVERAQLGTTAAAHSDGAALEVMYRLKGNVMDLALWLMLSRPIGEGYNYGSYLYAQPITSFVFVNSDESFENAIFFADIDLVEKYGVRVGDSIQTLDVDDSANLFTAYQSIISKIETRWDGTLVFVEGQNGNTISLVTEVGSSATASFVSPYNALNMGLGMSPDEVDIDEHERIKRIALSSFEVELYIKEETNIKELIEQQLYSVAGAYSLPRKSKASVGLTIGPIPGTNAPIITREDVTNAGQIVVRRTTNNNFANTIIYKLDKSWTDDEYNTGIVTTSATSKSRIPVGTKAMVIEADGLRTSLNGSTLATAASNRRLNRYKFGAEAISGLKVTYKKGFRIEVGDIVLLDADGLNLLNSAEGNRSPEPKLMEVINKSLDLRTGQVSLDLVDTSYSTQTRYCLISPASRIKAGTSTTQFIIEQWQTNSVYGSNEYLKWTRFLTDGRTIAVKVRSSNFTTRNAETEILSIVGNVVTLASGLGFTPQAGDFMELASFDNVNTTTVITKLYGFMADGTDTTFADGSSAYAML
jgi:hypothetical protein